MTTVRLGGNVMLNKKKINLFGKKGRDTCPGDSCADLRCLPQPVTGGGGDRGKGEKSLKKTRRKRSEGRERVGG